jgi:hypothetical protein
MAWTSLLKYVALRARWGRGDRHQIGTKSMRCVCEGLHCVGKLKVPYTIAATLKKHIYLW